MAWPRGSPYKERERIIELGVKPREREKKGFSLGRNERRRRAATRIAAKEKSESSQERELCVEKKIKMREQSVTTFEIDN